MKEQEKTKTNDSTKVESIEDLANKIPPEKIKSVMRSAGIKKILELLKDFQPIDTLIASRIISEVAKQNFDLFVNKQCDLAMSEIREITLTQK